MNAAELVRLASPPVRPLGSTDWNSAESLIGYRLPSDYKTIVDTYGEGVFWDNIRIGSPQWVGDRDSAIASAVELLRSLAVDHSPERLSSLGLDVQAFGIDPLGDMSTPPADDEEISPWEVDAENALMSLDVVYGTAEDTYLGAGVARSGQAILWRITDPTRPDSWPILVVGPQGIDYDASGLGEYLIALLSDNLPSCAFDVGWIDDCVRNTTSRDAFKALPSTGDL